MFAIFVVGGIVGAGALIASVEINHRTSTNEFCTSCHSMEMLAAEPQFAKSAHMSNDVGVSPSCGDCHIPSTNWFVETYAHVKSGIRDVIAENTNDFSDPEVWEARRIELAHEVRMKMREQDSLTCRSCHDATEIAPASAAGRAAHTLVAEGQRTCIDCHFNLVHAPVPPSEEFLRGMRFTSAGQ
jgi:nitrate/TMAO reductase-like tetraheme cytochrome c subunit